MNKITNAEVTANYVQSAPDKLSGSAAQNKLIFDKFPIVIKDKFNGLIDDLAGTGGADEIGITPITGVTGTTIQDALEDTKTQIDTKADSTTTSAHISNTSNPHSVTKAQVGLGNVDNTSDINKPISTLTQSALDLKEAISDANLLIKTIEFEPTGYEKTGKFKITTQGGTVSWIDTNLEKVPDTMSLIEDPVGSGTYYLVIYDEDDTEISRCPVTALFNAIEVTDTSTIDLTLATGTGGKKNLTASVKSGSIGTTELDSAFVGRVTTLETNMVDGVTDTSSIDLDISSHKITASVKSGGITSAMLESGLYDDIEGFKDAAETAATNAGVSETNASTYAGNASTSAGNASTSETNALASATSAGTSATSASANALKSEGHAVGQQNGEDVPSTSPYYHNNAKYWAEQAQSAASADMTKAVYDPTHSVENAGGIPAYVTANVPTTLASLSDDSTHRLVTDAEKTTWNGKSDKSVNYSGTLTVAGWVDNEQTLTISGLPTTGYVYIVSPVSDSIGDWTEAEIYAEDIETANEVTFVCTTVPTNAIDVQILKVQVG